jgi:hypothetical protein
MKKLLFSLLLLLGIFLIVTPVLCYFFSTTIITSYLEKSLNIPVSVKKIEFSKHAIFVDNLVLGNPPSSYTKEALNIKKIQIFSFWKDFFKPDLVIDDIQLDNTNLSVEFYNSSGTKNNWDKITKKNVDPASSQKHYLIKHLVINNLSVTVVYKNGTIKTFPTIKQIEFFNISDKSGFPIEEIQKAIFQEVLKSIYKRFGFDQLLNSLMTPEKLLLQPDKLIPFF